MDKKTTWNTTNPILEKVLLATPEALQGAQRRLQQADPAQQRAYPAQQANMPPIINKKINNNEIYPFIDS